jgi:hypothetical protein
MAMALVCGGFIAHIVGSYTMAGVGLDIKKAAHEAPLEDHCPGGADSDVARGALCG